LNLQILARLTRGVGDQPNGQTRAAQLVESLDRSGQKVLTDGDHAADVEQNASNHAKNLLGRSNHGCQYLDANRGAWSLGFARSRGRRPRASSPRASHPSTCSSGCPATHATGGSRFSAGSYGVYYAGREFETALRETVFHYEQFYADADMGLIRSEQMRVLVGSIHTDFHDIESLDAEQRARVMAPDDYTAGRVLAAALSEDESNGLVYPSVRNPGGACIGAFWPKAVGIPVQTKHLEYHWNGARIDKYFDYETKEWSPL
jgi:hypothetical protein